MVESLVGVLLLTGVLVLLVGIVGVILFGNNHG
jgi:hypothetical protein